MQDAPALFGQKRRSTLQNLTLSYAFGSASACSRMVAVTERPRHSGDRSPRPRVLDVCPALKSSSRRRTSSNHAASIVELCSPSMLSSNSSAKAWRSEGSSCNAADLTCSLVIDVEIDFNWRTVHRQTIFRQSADRGCVIDSASTASTVRDKSRGRGGWEG